MDTFTRNYAGGLAAIALASAGVWLYSTWTPRLWEINAQLAADPLVSAYPYHFRVTDLNQGTATLSTPRSFDVPAIQFLSILNPELASLAQDDPRLVAAQQRLVDAQKRAMELVAGLSDVNAVRWELDVAWLADHGIQAPNPGIKAAYP